jgi:tRNA dimethylallyltransferase
MSSPIHAIAVCGPTASGKTALGIALSKALGGEVVNVDSVQVYAGADIGSAKPSLAEREGVPHHLVDVVLPSEQMNAGEFREKALSALHDITARGKVPVLVGGSGMYLTILLHGIAKVPSTPPEVRAEVAQLSREEQYAELLKVDPQSAARLHINDTQRVSRALEVFRVTGKPASEFVAEHQFASHDVVALMVVLCRDRAELYDRINQRAQAMVESGLIEETAELLEKYGETPVLETLGYKQACAVLKGELARERCAEEIALHTRRFAKRQMTFLRNEPTKRGWLVRPRVDEPGREIVGVEVETKRARDQVKGFRVMEMKEAELSAKIAERIASPLDTTEVWYVRLVGE